MDKPEKRKLETSTTEKCDEDTSETIDKRRRVIGPALPPQLSPNADEDKSDKGSESNSDSDDEDDDDFGPSLPPAEGAASIQGDGGVSSASARLGGAQSTEGTGGSKSPPRRDAWMLLPPGSSDRSSRVDPTKLRNRKFQTGRAAGHGGSSAGVDSSWTETPEEKMKRLQNEAMGISSAPSGTGGDLVSAHEAKVSDAMREKIQRYNEQKRKEDASLVDARKKARGGEEEEKEDDPSSRAFDKEKDMALSSRITHAQRREMINKASDFGSRFTKGKFL